MKEAESNQSIIQALSLFIRKLNDECRNKALVVIEGQRDANALRSIGFEGDLFLLCHNGSLTKLASNAEKYEKIVLLLDLDRKGRALTKRTATILQEKSSNIDLFFRRELAKVTEGRIRHIEELARFRDHLQNLVIRL